MTRDRAGSEATLARTPARSVLPGNPAAAGPPEAVMAGKAAAENFPVALRMLPRRYRDHLMAVYSYARTVDDIGDEGVPEQRLALLADLEEDLRRLYAQLDGGKTGAASRPRHPAVRGLASVVTDCGIPMQPFRDLIGANQQDQLVSRYETFDELARLLHAVSQSGGPHRAVCVRLQHARSGRCSPTRSAPGCRSSSTSRTSPRTWIPAGSTCRPKTCAATAARSRIWLPAQRRLSSGSSSSSKPTGRAS